MHYYQFHIGDYKAATSHLSNEEDLAYRRLLDMYYDTEQQIPLDIQWVSRRLRLGSDVVQTVLNDMFEHTENGYKNSRADDEIQAYHSFLLKQKLNGKKGGRPKKTQSKPTANPEVTQVEPKKSLTTNHKPITNIYTATPEGVSDALWKDFLAIRKVKKLPMTETAMEGLKREAASASKSLSEALTICCERGWGGFNAKWLERDAPTGGSKQLTMQEEMALRAKAKR
jgi:uncharacterized protein YdaU (DUF1376 family)